MIAHARTTQKKSERIGLLGGSFNPAHAGHLAMSLFALSRLKLDQVWWLVSPQNPLKTRDEMRTLAARMKSARAFLRGEKNIIASDIETRMRTRFTIDTLRALKKKFPSKKFVWLMGEDNLDTIHLWKSWREIFLEVPVAVFRRSEYSDSRDVGEARAVFAKETLSLSSAEHLADASPPAWVLLDNKLNPLSASQIRQLDQYTSKSNPSHEGVRNMVAKKPAAKKAVKKVVKKAVKKVVKKAVKKVVKKVAKKPAAKKKTAKK